MVDCDNDDIIFLNCTHVRIQNWPWSGTHKEFTRNAPSLLLSFSLYLYLPPSLQWQLLKFDYITSRRERKHNFCQKVKIFRSMLQMATYPKMRKHK